MSRTPSTKTTQLGSNYSALTLKFGPLDTARISTLNHNRFTIPSANNSSSDAIDVKEVGSYDEITNFHADAVPFLSIEHPYHAVVRFEPMNLSYSQENEPAISILDEEPKNNKNENHSSNRLNYLAKKLKKCTQKAFRTTSDCDGEKFENRAMSQVGILEPSISIPKKNSTCMREVSDEC